MIKFQRIARKRKQEGRKSLTDDERAYYHHGMRVMRPIMEKFRAWVNDPATQAGFAAYEAMSPEDQERYGEWTPAQLAAFLPLLEELDPCSGDVLERVRVMHEVRGRGRRHRARRSGGLALAQ